MARDCVTVELGTAIESKELHRMKVIESEPDANPWGVCLNTTKCAERAAGKGGK